jgi:hypothetical protein
MESNAEYFCIGKPDSGTLIEMLKEAVMKNLKCHRVGRITSFDANSFTCKVQLLDKMSFFGKVENFVELPSLPLLVYGTDSKHITFGNIIGSECIVHFNDVDFDNWLETGESYTPNTIRKHDFADGFVELRPYNKNAVFTYYADGLEIQNGNNIVRLNDDSTISVTNGTTSMTISGDTVSITGNLSVTGTITSDTDCVSAGISGKTHVHSGVQSGSSNTGTPV